jgi:beta-lactamase class D
MRASFCLLSSLVALAVTLSGQAPPRVCVVVADNGMAPEQWAGTAADCATRLSPASTYKIPHALIGLETGVITTTTVEKWDGVRHAAQPKWNQDHTVLSSMRPSVLWFFQRMAPRIGAERAREWLQRFRYGNADASGAIAEYWVNGRLRISPDEQLAFLQRFYARDLPVSKAHIDAVTGAMAQAPGTVENARGVHRLDARWNERTSLNSKTGATTTARESVSWLVGQLSVGERRIVFASAVWRPTGGVDTLDATRRAVETFIARRVLER